MTTTLAKMAEHATTQQTDSTAVAKQVLKATIVNLTYVSGRSCVPIMAAVSSNLTQSLSVCVRRVDVSLHHLSLQLVASVSHKLFYVSIYIQTKRNRAVIIMWYLIDWLEKHWNIIIKQNS